VEGPLLDDLRDEHATLDALLASLDADGWRRATPAAGWTVADTVRHLVVAERAATRSARDHIDFVGPAATPFPRDTTGDPHLLDAWRRARADTLAAFASLDARDRVPWGGRSMAARSLATARLMETWAHGLDCFAALDREPVDTDRLVHVAFLGWRTLPFAFARVGETPPAAPHQLRLELDAPSGARWRIGPHDGDDVVAGPASTWCRLVTRRLRARSAADLHVRGPLATAAVRVAQAYLDG
jgi:uncharacterized protein (TIGR03084 family)